jgi:hypothetical protein
LSEIACVAEEGETVLELQIRDSSIYTRLSSLHLNVMVDIDSAAVAVKGDRKHFAASTSRQ